MLPLWPACLCWATSPSATGTAEPKRTVVRNASQDGEPDGDNIDSCDDRLDEDPDPLSCQITLDELGSVSSGKERFAYYVFQAGEPLPMSDIAEVRDGERDWRLPARGRHSQPVFFETAQPGIAQRRGLRASGKWMRLAG